MWYSVLHFEQQWLSMFQSVLNKQMRRYRLHSSTMMTQHQPTQIEWME